MNMKRVMLQEVNGPRQFHLHDSVWLCVAELIVASEALEYEKWEGLFAGRGCRVTAEEARGIASFIRQFLGHNPKGRSFAVEEEVGGTAAGTAPARTLSRPSVSRARLEEFTGFCEEVSEGFTVW